jgi:hypothetical protein
MNPEVWGPVFTFVVLGLFFAGVASNVKRREYHERAGSSVFLRGEPVLSRRTPRLDGDQIGRIAVWVFVILVLVSLAAAGNYDPAQTPGG